jgi:hypothetical protein
MKRLALHTPHGKNRYCGPTALSAITGLSTDACAAVVRQVNPRKRSVKGMDDWELIAAIRALGGQARLLHVSAPMTPKQTLAQWLDQRSEELRGQVLVVTAGWHYMTVLRDTMVCSLTRREKRHIASSPNLRCQLKSVIAVTPPAKAVLPKAITAEQALRQQERRQAASARRQALALAAELRLEVRRQGGDMCEVWVKDEAWWQAKLAPHGLLAEGEGALDAIGDRCRLAGYGWPDALDMLQTIKSEFGVDG